MIRTREAYIINSYIFESLILALVIESARATNLMMVELTVPIDVEMQPIMDIGLDLPLVMPMV